MAPVIEVTPAELVARRESILTALGLSLDEYLARAARSELTGDEWEARDDLDTIAFLLGESEFVD
ncbi:hypothetical protein MHM582_2149 [Microbacterium sp. HM58-2]|nr:hypothetical protein MHM582_2149 [Microbacterium sp. HM58-2]